MAALDQQFNELKLIGDYILCSSILEYYVLSNTIVRKLCFSVWKLLLSVGSGSGSGVSSVFSWPWTKQLFQEGK